MPPPTLNSEEPVYPSQKAPSAKRCIKTLRESHLKTREFTRVRKHRAPKGALRRTLVTTWHRNLFSGRKAPSAKRRINTCASSSGPQ